MLVNHLDVAELYVAMFQRVPEYNGFAYWLATAWENRWNKNTLAKEMAKAAVNLVTVNPLYHPSYPQYVGIDINNLNMEQAIAVVSKMYEVLFNKSYQEDPKGVEYWADLIANKKMDFGVVVSGMLEAAKDYLNSPDKNAQNSARAFVNKVDFALVSALAFVKDFDGDFQKYQNWIKMINEDPASKDRVAKIILNEKLKPDGGFYTPVVSNYSEAPAYWVTNKNMYLIRHKSNFPNPNGFMKIENYPDRLVINDIGTAPKIIIPGFGESLATRERIYLTGETDRKVEVNLKYLGFNFADFYTKGGIEINATAVPGKTSIWETILNLGRSQETINAKVNPNNLGMSGSKEQLGLLVSGFSFNQDKIVIDIPDDQLNKIKIVYEENKEISGSPVAGEEVLYIINNRNTNGLVYIGYYKDENKNGIVDENIHMITLANTIGSPETLSNWFSVM